MTEEKKDIAISVRKLTKVYPLYNSPRDRMKEALHPRRKKYHKDFYALKDVTFEIKKGEVIGIVGKNGSGKSTLLKILSRVLTPTSGEFVVSGSVSSLLELGSGFNPELTGMENIFFYGTILGFSEEKIKGKLDEMLDFADIGQFIYQPLKTYSSGMRARLAFSVAINVNPDILILDEVLAVGDELFRRKCYARMETFFKGGKTILYVSHDVSSVNQFCSRAIMIDRGEFLIEGPPKLVTAQYQRYLFSKPESMADVRTEIMAMNGDEPLKQAVYEEIRKGMSKEDSKKAEETSAVEKIKPELAGKVSDIVKQKAYYIPGLVPKSRVEYKNYDVDIYDVCITTLDGEKVNVLVTGEEYMYTYKVKFNIDAENVVFGMMIKDERGQILFGENSQSAPLKKINLGDVYFLNWQFTCNLINGLFYMNAGAAVRYFSDDLNFLTRIIDAVVFKVQSERKAQQTGYLFINIDMKFIKINQ